jgi:hypothetical protein
MTIRLILAAMLAASAGSPQPLAPFSSDRNDYNLSIDRAERVAVFARSDADFQHARILVSERVRGRWSEPLPIAFTDPRYSDSDPWLTPDGRTLYFVSDRPTTERGSRTDLDIWRSVRTVAGWSAPEHLGAVVNGPGPELGPELHGGVLTFSTVRRGGRGGLDIYAARQQGSSFSAPELLSGPFNSTESDSDFTLSRDGRTAAFWRGGAGTAKIFVARRTATGWSEPRPLPPSINHGPFNFTPAFLADGRRLAWASTAVRTGQDEGLADIFVAKLP